MAKDSINIFERYVDKVVLGLAGVFALAMLWMYILNTPNRVDFKGQPVDPRTLDEEILSSAEALQRAVRGARPEEVIVAKYSDQLRGDHEAALIASSARDAGPKLPSKLRRAASFGEAISVPGLEESEGAGDIVLVTPLPPSIPMLSTGRSVALRTKIELPGETPAAAKGDKKEPEKEGEFPWVSIAAYWDKQAQRDEMTKARYATYRTKVYVAGVDAQRQEMLASGEFSEWKDVPMSKTAIDIAIRDPIFDDESGAIINKDRVEQSYRQVKDYQAALLQPQFYEVTVGDLWEVPPIEGYTDDYVGKDDAGAEAERKARSVQRKKERAEAKKRNRPSRGRAPPSGGGGHGGAVGEGAIGGGGGIVMPPSRTSSPGGSTSAQRREAKKQMREDLRAAEQAIADKDYNLAINLANRVYSNGFGNAGTDKQADKIVARAERKIAKEQRLLNSRESGGELFIHPENSSKMVVLSHDDSVEPGKTYRYRLRVNLWNRYVGQVKPLRDAEEAKHCVLYGDWSPPSEPTAVTPSTYFFLSTGTFDQSGVNVDVFKWRQGDWLKQRFVDVQIGKVIGEVKKVKTDDYDEDGKPLREDIDFGTGVVVLDLRFAEPVDVRTSAGRKGEFVYRSQTSVVMVYLEPADGQVKERILALDRHDPLRKKLQDGG